MNSKSTLKVASLVLGLGAAFAVQHWPSQTRTLQMSFYSLLVLGIVLVFLWTQRKEHKVWPVICLALVIHAIALLVLQQYFPFRTVLVIVPFAFIEVVILFAIAIKLFEGPDLRGDGRK
jgi:uncharacterized membrane protein YhhN